MFYNLLCETIHQAFLHVFLIFFLSSLLANSHNAIFWDDHPYTMRPRYLMNFRSTSFPGLQCEHEGRNEETLVWAGHVSTQKIAVFNSYSSRSGEIFFNEIYKSSKQTHSQKTSQSIWFMCRTKFGTNQLKYMKTSSMFSKIYRYFWRFSTTGKAASKLHLGVSMQVVIHEIFFLSSWTISLLL
jgi:hypothetical protein